MAKVVPSDGQTPCKIVYTTSSTMIQESLSNKGNPFDLNNSEFPKKLLIYPKFRYLFTTRMLIAILMSSCFVALSVTTTNISGSFVCMILDKDENFANARIKRFQSDQKGWTNDTDLSISSLCSLSSIPDKDIKLSFGDRPDPTRLSKRYVDGSGISVEIRSCYADQLLNWTMFEQGVVLCAQNVGSLLMIVTGPQADRLNGKWTIAVALFVTIISNLMLPLLTTKHFFFAIAARILCGVADALLTPSISSMIARWFPPKERPFAMGFITGGRQIGSLLILPVSGWACLKKDTFGGWKLTFYISAAIGALTLFFWLILSADKPSKHCCMKNEEALYILRKINKESLGKRKERNTPWRLLFTSPPFIVGILAVVCQEYPLVITTTLLPMYMKEAFHLSDVYSTLYAALPLLALWISKNLSSSLSSFLSSRKKSCFLLERTNLVKLFNGIASAGLAIGLLIVPLLRHNLAAVITVCIVNVFAGMHTPGVFTALLQIAPAYTGSVTGIAYSAGHVANITNKLTSSFILHSWSASDGHWKLLYSISAATAFLPVIFFTCWGSADLQPWAIPKLKQSATAKRSDDCNNTDTDTNNYIQITTSPKHLVEIIP